MEESNEIYVKAEPKIIRQILESIRDRIGKGVDIVDLKPNYQWNKEVDLNA
jgi:hypothetical protein